MLGDVSIQEMTPTGRMKPDGGGAGGNAPAGAGGSQVQLVLAGPHPQAQQAHQAEVAQGRRESSQRRERRIRRLPPYRHKFS